MTSLVLLILAFLLLSGLMAAVDAAVLSVTRPEVQELVLQRKPGARSLRSLQGELTRAVVVIVILTNTINVLGPVVISHRAVSSYGIGALGIVTVVLTLGTIVFSEIVPKAIGTRYATVISRIAAFPIRLLQFVLYPAVVCLEWLAVLFTPGKRRIGTEQQIRSLATIGRRAGYIEQDEGRLIHKAFILNDRTAGDIMTPLSDVVSVNRDTMIGEAAKLFRRAIYSRYPVFGESADDVVGIAMIRDVLEAVADHRADEPIQSITRPVFLVDHATRSDALLMRFRSRHTHLAVVRQNDRTVGVVSLEDVLEELVGEIEDEKDSDGTGIQFPDGD
jgi:putative hemolysin